MPTKKRSPGSVKPENDLGAPGREPEQCPLRTLFYRPDYSELKRTIWSEK